ncbi:MAG: hypothetical protein DME97_05430 [Verrucomicrobia bacterium]|nr:MAG: hypothetical protein DME97_05430 [Verrucomicrobiota bacterium]
MTRFMLAFLADGTLEGATVLKPETVRAMEARQFELYLALHALGLILMDYSVLGQRIVGHHAGDTFYFHSDMILMPETRVGPFVSFNSAGSRFGGGRGGVIRAAMGLIVLTKAALRFLEESGVRWWGRVHAALLFLASIAFMSFAWYAHLLAHRSSSDFSRKWPPGRRAEAVA